jgi:hypothetical protein
MEQFMAVDQFDAPFALIVKKKLLTASVGQDRILHMGKAL